jgi:hypothetical protein
MANNSKALTPALVVALLTLSACGANTSGALNKSESCAEFTRIAADDAMSDDESATAFHELADKTDHATLAGAIRRVGDAYQRHDTSISSEQVKQVCNE